jgi:subtilase family serine protease
MRLAFASATALLLVLFAAASGSASAKSSKQLEHVCRGLRGGQCTALVSVDASGRPAVTGSPNGFNPPDFWSFYGLPPQTGTSWAWNGKTIAIVVAFHDPNLEADLGVYRSQFGLPPCTTGNGCLREVNQLGHSKGLPRFDETWAFEASVDTQMASAICAGCRLLVVEAKSEDLTNEFKAIDTAYALDADVISLSFGALQEFAGETDFDSHFRQLNAAGQSVAVTAATGDEGWGHLRYPAASPYVTAVGGTDIDIFDGSEEAWLDSGSGCSPYEPQPPWQAALPELATACSGRAGADVSFLADGMSVYDSAGFLGRTGWMDGAGTSVATPAIAAIYALAGNAATVVDGSYPYEHRDALFDVTQPQGAASPSCTSAVCEPGPGWDGPTGLGAPRGIGGF